MGFSSEINTSYDEVFAFSEGDITSLDTTETCLHLLDRRAIPVINPKTGSCIPVYREFECAGCGTKIIVKVRCKSRFCLDCARIRVNEQIEIYHPIISKMKDPRFITLTLKNCPLGALNEMRKNMLKYIAKLKRRKVFSSVKAGVWGLDITYNQESESWHLHIHMIVDSSYIAQDELSKEWCDITNGSSIVDIRRVYSRLNAAKELIKYIGKFYEIDDPSVLDELKLAFNGKKQCDCWGWAREERKKISSEIKGKKKLSIKCPLCGESDKWFYVDSYDLKMALFKRHHSALWKDYHWSYQCKEKVSNTR